MKEKIENIYKYCTDKKKHALEEYQENAYNKLIPEILVYDYITSLIRNDDDIMPEDLKLKCSERIDDLTSYTYSEINIYEMIETYENIIKHLD